MQRLSSLDAGFLNLERDRQQLHVGSLLVFAGPVPTYDEFSDYIASCLDRVPRYRQRVQRMPLDLARPIWVDDPHFALAYHLRHTALPSPGGDTQVRALVGRIMAQRLDADRPLWEMWLVEGMPDDQWAIITKTHHAMIDGLAGNELMETVLDRDPAAVRPPPSHWRPQPPPSTLDLAGAAAGWALTLPVEVARSAASAAQRLGDPSSVLRSGAVRALGLAQAGRRVAQPTSVLNGPIGPHRRWGWASAELATAKAIKDAAGCTVNDVVLAAIAGAFRQYLQERGEPVDALVLRSLVPVSIRTDAHRGALGNQVTAMFADLPVAVPDPRERLAAVARQMAHLKASGMAVGIESMLSAADYVPPTLMTLGARAYVRTGQRVVNAVTTNIPGPQFPLHLLGRRMLTMTPYIPIAESVRISIGIASYDGHLAFGVTGDYDAVPDLDRLCEAIGTSLDELAAAVLG
jgi:WS/DGAT/MGAT family acyltransferase